MLTVEYQTNALARRLLAGAGERYGVAVAVRVDVAVGGDRRARGSIARLARLRLGVIVGFMVLAVVGVGSIK